jgi:hypothetical protein
MMRLSTREAIRQSAPNLAFPVATNISPVLSDVEARIQDETGADFRFYTNERTVDEFTDGGIVTAQTKLWPQHVVAAVPAGEVVGFNAFAPVARAGEMSRTVPEAKIDRNGMAVFLESANNGRELTVERRSMSCQSRMRAVSGSSTLAYNRSRTKEHYHDCTYAEAKGGAAET